MKPSPPPIKVDFEKTSAANDDSYFNIDVAPSPLAKSPMLGSAMTSSRPSTPSHERRHFRTRTEEMRFSKREE